jgi:MFS family permease
MPPREKLTAQLSSSGDDDEWVLLESRRTTSSSSSSASSSRWPTNSGPLPVTTILPLLLFIDMFAVSLVVPLLFQYYLDAGVHEAHQREWLSALYSAAQIVGGLILGLLSDTGAVRPRTVLQGTFAGAAVSYGLILYGGQSIYPLMASRVVVGLIKHSYTVASALIGSSNNNTVLANSSSTTSTEDHRSHHLGRLNSAMIVAWIIGPSVGAILHRHVGRKVPVALACILFLVNLALVTLLLEDIDPVSGRGGKDDDSGKEKMKRSSSSKIHVFWSNLQSCFASRQLAAAVLIRLLVAFCLRATSSDQLGSYYEEMYGLERYQRGYLSSYGQVLQLLVQSLLVAKVLRYVGGERRAIVICAAFILISVWAETYRSLYLYLLVVTPVNSLATAVLSIALQSVVTQAAPATALFSVLAALDVLQNATAVFVPFYRTFWFDALLPKSTFAAAMHGDPDPLAFCWMSAAHWAMVVVATAYTSSMMVTSSAASKQRKD